MNADPTDPDPHHWSIDNNVVPGDALWVEEADVGRVEGTDQVDPGADVRLLVDPANIWTHLDSNSRQETKVYRRKRSRRLLYQG